VHGSNARNLSVDLSLSQTSKNDLSYVFSSTKLEKGTEQVLPGSKSVRKGRRVGGEMAQTMYTHMNK
jgi:hypothetical protein